MNEERREFLKWLSVTPLLAASACSSQSGTSQADRRTPAAESNAATSPAAPSETMLTPGDYASVEDNRRIRKTLSYSDGLPDNLDCPVTGPDILGPFHRPGAPKRKLIATGEEPGRRLVIQGRVLHHDCKTPIAGALLDIWHADAKGRYDNSSTNFRLRGQVTTDANGQYGFETIEPGRYPLGQTMRPAHIHFMVSYPGCHPLTTQLYFKGDPYLQPNDPCGGCNSGDPSLIIELKQTGTGDKKHRTGTFDIILAKA